MNRLPTLDPHVLTIADLKEAACHDMPKMYRDYYNEGAMDLITLKDNEAAFNRYKIRPRVMINVAKIDLETDIFGIKPSSYAWTRTSRWRVGNIARSSKSERVYGIISFCDKSSGRCDRSGHGQPIFHAHFDDQGQSGIQWWTLILITTDKVTAAGYKAIFLSVDVPVLGQRLNEHKNKFELPEGLEWPNLTAVGEGLEYDATIEWHTAIPWMRSQTKLEIWLKGVASPEDVALAIQHKVDGIMISNHGGRQLDGVPATLDSLRDCASVAKGKIPIAFDGGVRRGSDIFKALALGADFVFMGRVPIWGLAYKGQQGVELAVKILMAELRMTMALAGCRTVKEINRGHLAVLKGDGVLCKL
ncbi:FMN-dependent dehydrogenase [Aureobasidium pullulans]|nr:FMN-dependent dehydrogenase [Aureobasidium pullulans]